MMDIEQPGLCLEHCKSDATTAEQSAPQVPATMASVFYFAYLFLLPVPIHGRRLQRAALRKRAGALRLSILHCCYRI